MVLVSLIKLIDGTEVIGKIESGPANGSKYLKVSEPLKIITIPTRSGSYPTVSLQRYSLFTSEEYVEFKPEHILNICTVKPGVELLYFNTLTSFKDTVDKLFDENLASINMEFIEEEKSTVYKSILERYDSKTTLN